MKFEDAWREMEAKGYRYGADALEQVRLGYELGLSKAGIGRTVQRFHEKMRAPIATTKADDSARLAFCVRFLKEELAELERAIEACDAVEMLDAACDLTYVAVGLGIELWGGDVVDAALAEVHRSNMTKELSPDGMKAVKGAGYTKPNLLQVIMERFNS